MTFFSKCSIIDIQNQTRGEKKMAKISNGCVGKWADVSYKLNPQIRIEGTPQYELKVYLNNEDVFNNHRDESKNKISYTEALAIFNCLKYHNQLRTRMNFVGRLDSEGSMRLSYGLVDEYNKHN